MSIKLKILNPEIIDNNKTLVTTSVSTGTSLTVESTDFFSANDIILIGDVNTDVSESNIIDSITGETITLNSSILNTHLQGDSVYKLDYDQVKIYKATSQTGSYSLLTTIPLDYQSSPGITSYIDNVGLTTDWYKTSYYNSSNGYSSSLSNAVQGLGELKYLTVEEFRMRTGITVDEIDTIVLDNILYESSKDVRKKCYAKIENEYVTPKTINNQVRYFLEYSYLADYNLDMQITKDDLLVEEVSSDGNTINDITEHVTVINDTLGYIVLDTGYPTSGYRVRASYHYTNYKLEDCIEDLQNLTKFYGLIRILTFNMTGAHSRGISSQSLGGLTINRNIDTFEGLLKRYTEERDLLLERLKPLVFSPSQKNGSSFIQKYSYSRGRY